MIEDFKDRVPTKVLSNGAIRYAQYDAQGNLIGYTYFKRADDPTEPGNMWNKVIYDMIKNAIDSLETNKLSVTNKASASEATAGTNDTKYMTPLKTKQALRVNKIINNNIPLSETANTTVDLTQYIDNDVVELDIILSAQFKTNYTSITIAGNSIYKDIGGYDTGAQSSVNIGDYSYIYHANLLVKIFPKQKSIIVEGFVGHNSGAQSGTGETDSVFNVYSYKGISSISFGKIYAEGCSENPLTIIQYKE